MTEPNAYFRQHYAVDAPQIDGTAFRPWWKVRPKERPKLDQLLIDRAISITEYRAGQRFRDLAAIVLAGDFPSPRWLDETRANGRGGLDLAISRRRDARYRLERIRDDLGPVGFALLEYHLVKDWDWTTIGARFLRHRQTVRVWTIAALRRLAVVIWT